MINEASEIRVRLTPNGLKKYHRLVHLRPMYTPSESNNSIYVFRCTEAQAEYYFFKFGEDAQIIQPVSLAKKFETMYQRAADRYAENNNN